MARPLVIFPIFAPYRCWMSSVDHGMPMNRFVLERLLKVDPASQPFLCVQACNKYLAWRAPTLSLDDSNTLPALCTPDRRSVL